MTASNIVVGSEHATVLDSEMAVSTRGDTNQV